MSLKKSSKELLADAIKELLSQRELKDISVESILELSGVSRTTFYKHFIDKYELAKRVFLDELAEISFFNYDRPMYELEADILNYLDENRMFYRNALKCDEFRQAWLQAAYRADVERLLKRCGGENVAHDDLVLFANCLSRAMVDATWLWINEPCDRTAEDMARQLATFAEFGVDGLFHPRELSL